MMHRHPQFRAYAALAAVCFFWGTTYLGIRIALESFPPALLMGTRYTISGAIMLMAALIRKSHLPSGRELLLTSVFGAITIGVGTGCLVYAEQWIPSGLAALFITTSPFWLVGLEAALPGGARLHVPTILGMLVGLSGTFILVAPGVFHSDSGSPILIGFALLQLGCFGWSLGSILQRRQTLTAHPIVGGAIQQLAAGIVFLVPALLLPHSPVRWTGRGLAAISYLVVFGSIVGYSAYVYVLQHLPVSIVSIYNYVNPVVAVVLGYLFYREPLGVREILATLVIFAGVALVKRFSSSARPHPSSVRSAVPEASQSVVDS